MSVSRPDRIVWYLKLAIQALGYLQLTNNVYSRSSTEGVVRKLENSMVLGWGWQLLNQ